MILIERLIPESQKLADMGVRIGIGLAAGFLVQRVLFLIVRRLQVWIQRAGHGHERARQRARTIGQIFRNLVTVLVGGSVVVYALGVLGWDVRPLLAGAGILGVALGFGAQTLVRDVIAGVFIFAEDQFGVGDLIEVNGKAATVEALTVRCTTLRDFNGFVHYVPNGELKTVVNRSRGWNRLAVDVPLAADEDVDRALELCRGVAAAMNADLAWKARLLDDIQVWGVELMGGQELQLRMVVRAEPGSAAHDAARELRRRVQRSLVQAGLRTSVPREIGISAMDVARDVPPARAS